MWGGAIISTDKEIGKIENHNVSRCHYLHQ